MKGISVKNTEKDYLLDVCLHSLSRYRNNLVFKGGTALYKFHNLNRFSEDLDFTLNKRRFDFEEVGNRIVRECDLIGITANIANFDSFPRAVNITLKFRGPLFDGSVQSMARVAFDFSLKERPYGSAPMFYTSMYKELPSFELYVMDPEEMLAEKVRAVMTREKPRDVYDLWFLLKNGNKLDEALVDKKLKLYKLHYSRQDLLKRIEDKRKMWVLDLKGLIIGGLPEFDNVTDEMGSMI